MKKTLRLTVMAFVAMSLVAFAACKKDDPKPEPQGSTPGTDNPGTPELLTATITFDSSYYRKSLDNKNQLIKFTVTPADVKYEVAFSNEGVVSPEGEGYAPARTGNTVMTVTINDDRYQPTSASCHICVTPQQKVPTMPTPGEFVTMGQSISWSKFQLGHSSDFTHGIEIYWAGIYNDNGVPYYNTQTGKYTKYYAGDNLRRLEDDDDLAFKASEGEHRIPTKEESEYLVNNCAWVPCEIEGHPGFMVIAPSNNRIFVPVVAEEDMDYDYEIRLWTSDVCEIDDYTNAYAIHAVKMDDGACEVAIEPCQRSNGCRILPVK